MWVSTREVREVLLRDHYLGPVNRGLAWRDDFGVLVLAKPTSRRLPQDGTWLELVRWCLKGEKNGGSRQWRAVTQALRALDAPIVTTVISYSDPSVGHTGALYRACNWVWRPTWHRLRPPPSGNGNWGRKQKQSVKDRWAFFLTPDSRQDTLLAIQDASIVKRIEESGYSLARLRNTL